MSDVWTRLKYNWGSGTGHWAGAHQRWASAPGRRFPGRVHTSENLSVVYEGFPEGLTYILPYLRDQQAVVDGPVSVADTAPVTWQGIQRSVREPEGDLLVIGCSHERALRLPRARSVVLPLRLHLLIDIVADAETMHKTVSKNERRQFANLRRKHEWTYEIGTADADFEFFYERMHLPTMASRYGDEARSADRDLALNALFRRGLILFVNEGGKRVAGVLCRLEDDAKTVRMRLLGVLDGDFTHYRTGAVKAVYYLTIEWAADTGRKLIDFSGGDPFPGKGVFQFKRRFHPTVAHARDHLGGRRAYLRVVRDSPAVRDLLVATPMFTVDDDNRIVATHFTDRSRPALAKIRMDGAGVHAARTVDLDGFLGSTVHAGQLVGR
ncbi:Acetyltransferase (GNAT) domain-containing protein [Amycolatopsis arida]|uniref:Acetyltransferase (GNAT) domain-containing protein n=1 Tax=Amycolatopsis arida TaxID=587909 RepID=A0A1I5QAM4_9PSEU|nr:GNAT family N-acetyltransferase [Amycolatopsis arida]TDX98773.1 acetyltransferase (GNAT) family protein [Amycolatopsis arida]SFP43322.1 Acetyltransferase (GNAT) domain-containing protein [Amycolatopsis arida]